MAVSDLNLRQIALVLILVSQLFFSFVVSPIIDRPDVFPFHRWALFQKAAKGFTIPVLYIHEWDGSVYDPPETAHDFFKGNRKVDFLAGWDHINYWSQVVESDPDRARMEKLSFEKHYFGSSKVTYSIRMEKVDQVQYRKDRSVISTEKLHGPFRYDGGEAE